MFDIKKIIYLIVIYTYSICNAGSYEDFFKAIERDDVGVVSGLLKRGFDPNTPSPQSEHGLILALREPSPKVASVLIAWPQTQVDVRNANDETPLMMASLKGQLALVGQLVVREADVNKPGWTPLHYAATGGHVAVMLVLLEHSAYIDASSPNGSTPLMMAAMYGSASAVKLLLEEGADPSLKNEHGLTAFDFATQAKKLDSVQIIEAFVRGLPRRGN